MPLQLISDEYKAQQESLHESAQVDGKPVVYGGASLFYAPIIADVINKIEPGHVLDYGCGKHLLLARALRDSKIKQRFKYQAYDPAVPKYAGNPVPAEMVVCLDVLEHIEEDKIDDVLDHLQELTEAVGFFTIHTGPAIKTLPDGRNAHILQRPAEWWLPRVMCRFELQSFQVTGPHQFYVLVTAQQKMIEGEDGKKL
jgi:hypothetical protein